MFKSFFAGYTGKGDQKKNTYCVEGKIWKQVLRQGQRSVTSRPFWELHTEDGQTNQPTPEDMKANREVTLPIIVLDLFPGHRILS